MVLKQWGLGLKPKTIHCRVYFREGWFSMGEDRKLDLVYMMPVANLAIYFRQKE
jgi:hypothetical protein